MHVFMRSHYSYSVDLLFSGLQTRICLALLVLIILLCGHCIQASKTVAHRSVLYFDKVTADWHQQLHKEVEEKVHRLQVLASSSRQRYSTTNPRDKEAMVALYTSTNGDNWYNNSNWMKGDPCDDRWYGLYCINGRVLQINMAFNNMAGPLPAKLVLADRLQVVRLYSNRLNGTLPAEILQMQWLQILGLETNQITGTLPNSISMANITSLHLYQNNLVGQLPRQWDTPRLQDLEVSSNMFTGDFPDFSGCKNLQTLVASRNNISGDFPSNLGTLRNLQKLWLFNNDFKLPEIPSSWAGLTAMQDMELDHVSGKIPTFIGESWSELVHLVIVNGTLTGEFDTALCNLQQLEDLRLFENKLSGMLPTCICELRNLITLELSDNQFSGSIPYCLGSLSKLESLYFSRNSFSGILPSSIGSLANLQIMDVSSNALTGPVPSTYAGLTEIVGFSLCYNKLYKLEDGLEPLYNRIKDYSCELYDNPWSCPLPSNVPASCSATCSKCNTGAQHTDCTECVADVNCGWCSEGPNCLEGTASGPHDYQCSSNNWSYGSKSVCT